MDAIWKIGLIVLLLATSTSLADPPPRSLFSRPPTRQPELVMDVSLTDESTLEGHLIDAFGKVQKETKVTLVQNRKVVWSGKTDSEGYFVVQGLPSGVYDVDSGELKACCRVWTKDSAPPRALRSLLLTRDVPGGKGQLDSRKEDWTIRISGFSTMTLPRMTTRDVRKVINP